MLLLCYDFIEGGYHMCFVKKQKSVESKIKRKFRGYFHKFSFPKVRRKWIIHKKTMSISDFFLKMALKKMKHLLFLTK